MDLYVASANEAAKLCKSLQREQKADLFRGQTNDWPRLLPSLLRPGVDRQASDSSLEAFLTWARSVPQMALYEDSEPALIAIAQHYGIPTHFLDLTTNPEIALLFAKPNVGTNEQSNSVIYCFLENELSSIRGARIVRLDVINLWRLESQDGLFLEFIDDDLSEDIRNLAVRIHFPSPSLTTEEYLRLYPARKSALELVIDQWMYRTELDRRLRSFTVEKKYTVRRISYPGVFRWRSVPELEADWIDFEQKWIFPRMENFAIATRLVEVSVPRFPLTSPSLALDNVRALIEHKIERYYNDNFLLNFRVFLSPEKQHLEKSVTRLVNRCWDGIRAFPYTSDEVISSLTLTIVLLCARAEDIKEVPTWIEYLLGDTELIETAPVGGHIEAGLVSAKSLIKAYSDRYKNQLTSWMRHKWEQNPKGLMTYIVDPWILFDFGPFKKLYVEEFVPTSIYAYWSEDLDLNDGNLDCMWSISFNPALLGYVTNSEFRFYSPVALERDVEHIIFVEPDMGRDDIEELFISCLPTVLTTGVPYQVKFNGYTRDTREIWQIDTTIQQCKWILEISGISVLEVSTLLKNEEEEETPSTPFARGAGAFEIWMIATGKYGAMRGTPLASHKPAVDQFFAALAYSNSDLEARAKNQSDWPMTSQLG